MAEQPKGYGMTFEIKKKLSGGKFDPDLAQEVFAWIKKILGEPIGDASSITGIQESLKDGVRLCKLVNTIEGKERIRISTSPFAFKQMENIGNFLDYSYSIGCPKLDMFQTVDLYEGQNIPQVIDGLSAFATKASRLPYTDLPSFGPQEPPSNKRKFTEEQFMEGESLIGFQMDRNRGNPYGIQRWR